MHEFAAFVGCVPVLSHYIFNGLFLVRYVAYEVATDLLFDGYMERDHEAKSVD